MVGIIPVITIDGPSSVGKGTLSKLLAKFLKWHILDSGAIYRALALAAINHKISLNNEKALISLAICLDINFLENKLGNLSVLLEGKDVSKEIRHNTIGNLASLISVLPCVREALISRQRAFRIKPGLIADGRDMGTVIFRDALIKVFLKAKIEERAYRRMQQLQKEGFNVNFNHLLFDIKERDNRDRKRATAPMLPAVDALILDSTYLSIDKLAGQVLVYAKQFLCHNHVID